MGKRLLIIGAGAFGREVLGWAQHAEPTSDWTIGGFLNSDPNSLDGFGIEKEIFGNPDEYVPQPNDVFVCAIGDPQVKLRICRGSEQRGGQFISLVHPTSVIGPNCKLGEGAILCPQTVLTTNVTLGRYVTLNVGSTIGHDVVVGDGCTLSGHCDLTGGVQLGKGVFFGSHAVVLPGGRVGDFATVGAGSVVLRKVRPHTTVMGVPAKLLYSNKEDESS
jgi:sugar O-acyltransferase (sialic acid O-acetyltransferase NeuD family)